MTLLEYQKQRQKLLEQEPQFRKLCINCLQPEFGCYCPHIQKFDPQMEFVILIHPIEMRRRIATGRMSHLCLENSHLIMGQDYSNNEQVNQLLADPRYEPVMLYPGPQSINLTTLSTEKFDQLFSPSKKLLVFVIDGTWATARKMVRLSHNLHSLPRVCFIPEKPSNFRVRKQPKAYCYSTIEAIHHLIELIGPHRGFEIHKREHDRLLSVFDGMVQRQLEFIQKSHENPGYLFRASYHRQCREKARSKAQTKISLPSSR